MHSGVCEVNVCQAFLPAGIFRHVQMSHVFDCIVDLTHVNLMILKSKFYHFWESNPWYQHVHLFTRTTRLLSSYILTEKLLSIFPIWISLSWNARRFWFLRIFLVNDGSVTESFWTSFEYRFRKRKNLVLWSRLCLWYAWASGLQFPTALQSNFRLIALGAQNTRTGGPHKNHIRMESDASDEFCRFKWHTIQNEAIRLLLSIPSFLSHLSRCKGSPRAKCTQFLNIKVNFALFEALFVFGPRNIFNPI